MAIGARPPCRPTRAASLTRACLRPCWLANQHPTQVRNRPAGLQPRSLCARHAAGAGRARGGAGGGDQPRAGGCWVHGAGCWVGAAGGVGEGGCRSSAPRIASCACAPASLHHVPAAHFLRTHPHSRPLAPAGAAAQRVQGGGAARERAREQRRGGGGVPRRAAFPSGTPTLVPAAGAGRRAGGRLRGAQARRLPGGLLAPGQSGRAGPAPYHCVLCACNPCLCVLPTHPSTQPLPHQELNKAALLRVRGDILAGEVKVRGWVRGGRPAAGL